MSAVFDLSSLLTVLLLFICTCTFLKPRLAWIQAHKTGTEGVFWKAARIGERLSPFVSLACLVMAFHTLFVKA